MTDLLRLLLVEDNVGDAVLLRETLRDCRQENWFELQHVTRLEDGLIALSTSKFDLILLDLSLPDAHGLETLSRTRAHCGATPIVVLTGMNDETVAVRAVQEGAQDYLVKGVDAEVLSRSIRYAIERQRMLAELAQVNELQRHLANHDALTGLPNRQLFYDRLEHALSLARREDKSVAVLFVDLDDFKLRNDSLGHDVGDRLLKVVAERVAECVRSSDTAARLGGDEFTFILYDIPAPEDAARVAHTILDAVAEPITVDANELHITASCGISMYPSDGEGVETMVRNADMAMYRAKAAGRNNYQFYLPSMNERAMQRMDMEHRLRAALDRGQISAHFQPKVDVRTGAITGMEALARWRLPGGNMVDPAHFIPLAEETGLIIPLGEHILQVACEQARAWLGAGLGTVPVAVNLSTRQLLQRPTGRNARYNLIDIVGRALEEFELPPAALELEVTESAFLKDVELGISILGRLRDLGVPIAIDDFGTGFSSLNYLKMLPAEKIKVDRSFVRMLNHSGPDATIVSAVISMAHGLGMKVVAEGVETVEQFERLRRMNCDEMQGYLISPAVDGERATKLLEKYLKKPAA